jgi:REP element-mobilizing transposase RayT
MVIAYHVTFATYGFWLPNDPRGSNSDYVRAAHLKRFGEATFTSSRRSVAGARHDSALRAAAKRALMYPAVVFDGRQALSVAKGFAKAITTGQMRIFACAILPCHVHLVVARHRYRIEQVVNLLKGAATRQLIADGLHPLERFKDGAESIPSPWGRDCRKIYIDDEAHLLKEIDYVARNPLKEHKPLQRWSFVIPYNGASDRK